MGPPEQRSSTNLTANGKVGVQFNEIFGLNLVGRYTETKLNYTTDDFSVFQPWGPSYGRPADMQSFQRSKQDYERAEITANFLDGRFKNWFGASRCTPTHGRSPATGRRRQAGSDFSTGLPAAGAIRGRAHQVRLARAVRDRRGTQADRRPRRSTTACISRCSTRRRR